MPVFEILDTYTGELQAVTPALGAADALAHFSLATGFADPRETAAQSAEWGREPMNGAAEQDFYWLRNGITLGMVYTNTAVHAVRVHEIDCAHCGRRTEATESLLCETCQTDAEYALATSGGTLPHVSDGEGADGWPIRLAEWYRGEA